MITEHIPEAEDVDVDECNVQVALTENSAVEGNHQPVAVPGMLGKIDDDEACNFQTVQPITKNIITQQQ